MRVNGGIRVESYDTTSHAVTAAGVATDIEGDGTLVSGKAGLVFRLNDRGQPLRVVRIVAHAARDRRTSRSMPRATNQNNPNVDPQESTNYELGTKWELAGNRLQLTGAVFRTENTNVIFVVDGTAVPPIFNQDDGQRVKGATVGARRPDRAVVGRQHERAVSGLEGREPEPGDQREAARPDAGSLRQPLDDRAAAASSSRIGGGVRYTDAVFVNAANTTVIPGYTVADALVEAPVGQHLTLRLNIYNLTDRVYIRNINNNAGRYNPGTPRSFLLSSARSRF